jgi:hypothetical protein
MSKSRKSRLTAMGTRCADHVTPSVRKSSHQQAAVTRGLNPRSLDLYIHFPIHLHGIVLN